MSQAYGQCLSISENIWYQRRDSNSQTPVSKTGCYSNSHTLALLVHREGFEPPRPTQSGIWVAVDGGVAASLFSQNGQKPLSFLNFLN